jgi:hypothetical protein
MSLLDYLIVIGLAIIIAAIVARKIMDLYKNKSCCR